MMLRFIEKPEENGSGWFLYSGLITFMSFGVERVDELSEEIEMLKARDQLIATIGAPMLAWLRSLPSIWRSGNAAAVHAGAAPFVAMECQALAVLHWGHPDLC